MIMVVNLNYHKKILQEYLCLNTLLRVISYYLGISTKYSCWHIRTAWVFIWNMLTADANSCDVMRYQHEHTTIGESWSISAWSSSCQLFSIHVRVKYFQFICMTIIFMFTFRLSIFMFLPSCNFMFSHVLHLLLFLAHIMLFVILCYVYSCSFYNVFMHITIVHAYLYF